jgi:hypothetical protein
MTCRTIDRNARLAVVVLCGALAATACGSSSTVPVVEEGTLGPGGPADDVGYRPNTDVVVVGGMGYVVTNGVGEECVQIGDQCMSLGQIKQEHCGDADAQADIVMAEGKVIDVICYPPQDSGVSIHEAGKTTEGTVEVPQNANNTVITFDETTNGVAVQGNVDLKSENIALIGNGVDKTIIDGNLHLDSNNAHVRGLTVNGNVTFDKNSNGATLAFCKIKGNLEIKANNMSVIACQVFGNVKVEGNSTVLVEVGVGGEWSVTSALVCEGNYAFADGDGNFDVVPAELGADLTCQPKG